MKWSKRFCSLFFLEIIVEGRQRCFDLCTFANGYERLCWSPLIKFCVLFCFCFGSAPQWIHDSKLSLFPAALCKHVRLIFSVCKSYHDVIWTSKQHAQKSTLFTKVQMVISTSCGTRKFPFPELAWATTAFSRMLDLGFRAWDLHQIFKAYISC